MNVAGRRRHRSASAGCVVTAGATLTVSVAAAVVARADRVGEHGAELVAVLRSWPTSTPRSASSSCCPRSVVSLVHVAPPSVDDLPLDRRRRVARCRCRERRARPALTVTFAGGVVTIGAMLTVSVAVFVLTELTAFVNTAR